MSVEDVADIVIPAAVNHLSSAPDSTLKEVYFLAFRSREKNACHQVLERLQGDGVLGRVEDA